MNPTVFGPECSGGRGRDAGKKMWRFFFDAGNKTKNIIVFPVYLFNNTLIFLISFSTHYRV